MGEACPRCKRLEIKSCLKTCEVPATSRSGSKAGEIFRCERIIQKSGKSRMCGYWRWH
jgi:hypothetical protein